MTNTRTWLKTLLTLTLAIGFAGHAAHAQPKALVAGPARSAPASEAEGTEDSGADLPGAGTLYLRNGDYLPGRMSESGDLTWLRWQSPLFREPIRFHRGAVTRIVFDAQASSDAHLYHSRVLLRDGRSIFGRLVALDDEKLTMESPRHGRFALKRSVIDRVDSLRGNPNVLLDGLVGLTAWKAVGDKPIDRWQVSPDGKLTTSTPGAALLHRYDHDGPVWLELELEGTGQPQQRVTRVLGGVLRALTRATGSSAAPEFQLTLGSGPDVRQVKDGFSVEHWQQEIHCHRQTGDRLELKTFPASAFLAGGGTIRLQVYLDPRRNRMLLYSNETFVGEFASESDPRAGNACLFLRNNGRGLAVRNLRLRKWNGEKPSSLEVGSQYVRVSAGDSLPGGPISLDERTRKLTVGADGETREVALEDVDVIQFAPLEESAPVASPQNGNVFVTYADGTVLNGELTGMVDDGVIVRNDYAATEMRLSFTGATNVEFRPAETPPADAPSGLFEMKGGRLHGVVALGTDVQQLKWQPAFSDDSVPVDLARDGQISFNHPATTGPIADLRDELHLTNGDVLPCELIGIDEQSVHVRLDKDQQRAVERKFLKAVRLNHPDNLCASGFGEPDDWSAVRMNSYKYELGENELTISGRGAIARDVGLPERARVRFNLQWKSDGMFMLGLGGETTNQPRSGSTHCEVLFSRQGDRLRAIGRVMVPTRFGLRSSVASHARVGTLKHSGAAPVQIEVLYDQVAGHYLVMANGTELFAWRDATNRAEGGRVFLLTPVVQDVYTGNMDQEFYSFVSPHQTSGNQSTTADVHLSGFEICRWAGVLDEESRERLLTRPRGARPKTTGYLLRAMNGDTLRGHLVSVEREKVLFEIRHEILAIDRAQVAEIISLEPPDPASPDTITARLHRGGLISFDEVHYGQEHLVGTSTILGEHRVSWDAVASFKLAGRDKRVDSPLLDWTLREPIPLPAYPQDESDPGTAGEGGSSLVGQTAADFELPDPDGETIRLRDLRGKTVVLDFWATWCGPCLLAMPQVIETVEEFKDRDVVLIGVNLQEEPPVVSGFLKSKQWKLRVALDRQGQVAKQYGVTAIPQTMIIDPEGTIRAVHLGAAENLKQALREELKQLVGAEAAPCPAPTQ